MVHLTVQGLRATLSNEELSISFDELGKSQSLTFHGVQLLNGLTGSDKDPDKTNSFYCDYHVNGKTRNIIPTRLEVIEDTPPYRAYRLCG